MKKVFILIICFLLTSCSTNSVFQEVIIDQFEPTSSKLTLTMVGDALKHSSIYKYAYEKGAYNFSKIFTDFKSEITTSDLLYYNQETILGGEILGFSGYPRFNTPKEFGETMIDMGFNIVSRANNHTLDMNEAGILNSCNFWNKYPSIITNGSACTKDEKQNPKVATKNGISYALLSYTISTNGLKSPNDYYVNIYSNEIVKKDIEAIRENVDVLLVAMHWGDEYKSIPNAEQKRIAKLLADLEVDIVIGTHPHVIQPIEWIDDTLIIYSLGNFISSQTTANNYARLIGLEVNLDIIKTITKNKTDIKFTNLNTELLYTYYKNSTNYKVIPFSKLNDSILSDYKNLRNKYNSIIKYYDNNITCQ